VWLHPPRNIQLNAYDELFVLCEKNEKDNLQDASKAKDDVEANGVKNIQQNQGKKI
jgi:hypothetical protein